MNPSLNKDRGPRVLSEQIMHSEMGGAFEGTGRVRESTDHGAMESPMWDVEARHHHQHHQAKTISIIIPDGKKVRKPRRKENQVARFVPASITIPKKSKRSKGGKWEAPCLDTVAAMAEQERLIHERLALEAQRALEAAAAAAAEEEKWAREAEERVAREVAQEAEAKRLAQEAEEEARRLAQEAEEERSAQEAEAKRLLAREAEEEAQRLAREAEEERLAQEAEANRLAEAEEKRLAQEAEAERLAEQEAAAAQKQKLARRQAGEEWLARQTEEECLARQAQPVEPTQSDEEEEVAEQLAAAAEAKRLAEEAEELRREAQRRAKREAKAKAAEEWAARILEEQKKAEKRKLNSIITPDGKKVRLVEDDDVSPSRRSMRLGKRIAESERRRKSTGQMGRRKPRVLPEPMDTASDVVFEELREEIRRVKFPERKKKKTVTIMMPDGKKVKQVKQEDEPLAPVPLMLEGRSRKGDIYVRADGKRVRLVKRKEKKRKEKLKRKKMKEEFKRLRKEAELRAQREQEELARAQQLKEARRQLIERDWGEMSWQEAEEEQERIIQEAWQAERAAKTEPVKRSRHLSSSESLESNSDDNCMIVEDTTQGWEEESDSNMDEDSLSPDEAVDVWEAESALGTNEEKRKPQHSSQSVSEDTIAATEAETVTLEMDEQQDMDISSSNLDQSTELRDPSASTLCTVSSVEPDLVAGNEEEVTEMALRQFCTSLLQKKEEQKQPARLSFTQRMTLKSIEVLNRADRMKRLSEFACSVGDLQAQRFRYVGMPRHRTQGLGFYRS